MQQSIRSAAQSDLASSDVDMIGAGAAEDSYETDDFDGDSAYDSASLIGDDTNTLASYITDYRYEHGRRYHAYRDGAYWVCSPRSFAIFQRLVLIPTLM
jgi:hypothetical protein